MRSLLRPFARIIAISIAVAVILLSLAQDTDDMSSVTDLFSLIGAYVLGDAFAGDKVSHFVAYAALGAAGVMGFSRSVLQFFTVLVSLVVLGGILEFAQGMTETRIPDPGDMLANGLGILTGGLFGLIAILLVRKLWPEPCPAP